jgi:hypothetical protein
MISDCCRLGLPTHYIQGLDPKRFANPTRNFARRLGVLVAEEHSKTHCPVAEPQTQSLELLLYDTTVELSGVSKLRLIILWSSSDGNYPTGIAVANFELLPSFSAHSDFSGRLLRTWSLTPIKRFFHEPAATDPACRS